MTLRRIPTPPRPPVPPAPPAPPTEDARPIRRLWWPQRRHYLHSTWEVPVRGSYPYLNGTTRTRTSNRYDQRWFWPGQRVRVSTVTMEVDGGLLNLFVPFAIVLAMARPTHEVEVYELVAKDGETK